MEERVSTRHSNAAKYVQHDLREEQAYEDETSFSKSIEHPMEKCRLD